MGRSLRHGGAGIEGLGLKVALNVTPQVAVTGASGFISRHVLAELDRLGVPATLLLRPGAALHDTARKHRVVRLDLNEPPPDAFELAGRSRGAPCFRWHRGGRAHRRRRGGTSLR